MANQTILHIDPTGTPDGVWHAFPGGQSFADWDALKVPMNQMSPPDAQVYPAVVDDAISDLWFIFYGAEQPSSLNEHIAIAQLVASSIATVAAINADATQMQLQTNAAYLGDVIDGLTFTEAQRIMLSAMRGDITGGGTGTVRIAAADGSKTRITATYDEYGNRTTTAVDAS